MSPTNLFYFNNYEKNLIALAIKSLEIESKAISDIM